MQCFMFCCRLKVGVGHLLGDNAIKRNAEHMILQSYSECKTECLIVLYRNEMTLLK